MPTYEELLNTAEWRNKRFEILTRDNFICQKCRNENIIKDYDLSEGYISLDSDIVILDGDKRYFISCGASVFMKEFVKTLPEKFSVYFTSKGIHKVKGYTYGIDILGIQSYNKKLLHLNEINLKIILAKKHEVELILSEKTRMEFNAVFQGKTEEESIKLLSQPFEQLSKYYESESDKWHYVFGLNVHHHYYQEGLMPWDYPNDAYISYCKFCHQNLHDEIKVSYKDINGSEIGNLTVCDRCGGSGDIPQFWYVENGICFKCRGARYIEFIKH